MPEDRILSTHLPGLFRDQFLVAVDAVSRWHTGQREPECAFGTEHLKVRVSHIAEFVSRSSDRLPGLIVQQLQDMGGRCPDRASYADGARALTRIIQARLAASNTQATAA